MCAFSPSALGGRYRGQLSIIPPCWVRRCDSFIAVGLASLHQEIVHPEYCSLAVKPPALSFQFPLVWDVVLSPHICCISSLAAPPRPISSLRWIHTFGCRGWVMQWCHGGACFLWHVAFPRSLFAGVTTRAQERQRCVCFVGNDSV